MPQLDPLALQIILGALGFVVIVILAAWWQRRRERRLAARYRAEWQTARRELQMQQAQIDELAGRIVATSSTGQIAGFDVIRQVETLFTDGHKTPAEAAQHLKALAAQKGANALVNLAGERPPSGKCSARADAVIVQTTTPPAGAAPESPPPPPPPAGDN